MFLTADFGIGNGGIGTVGYELLDNTGATAQARTTTGVVDLDDGAYGVEVDVFESAGPNTARFVKWDTGGGSPIFAHEDLAPIMVEEIHRHLGHDVSNPNVRVKTSPTTSTIDAGADVSLTVVESPTDTVTVTRV